MGTSLQQVVLQALAAARSSGQPMIIPNAGGLLALPNGQTRMAQPGEIGPRAAPSLAANPFGPVPTAGPGVPAGTPGPVAAASPGFQLGANVGTPIVPGSWFNSAPAATPSVAFPPVNVTAPARDPVLNQVNPNVQTYAGQPGYSGDATANAARNYRLAHGLGTAQDRMTADRLNAMSLQAAQQGRTYWPPGTTVGTGQYAPNLLQMPPAAVPANANALAGVGAWLPNIHWLQGLAGPSGPPDNAQGGGGGVG